MTYLRTFNDFAPPSRSDGVPFTTARIYENLVPTFSTATLIDTITLTPVDTNPAKPVDRDLTATHATIAQDGYYWIVWVDGNGVEFISPVIHSQTPTLSPIETLIRSEMPQTWDGLAKDNFIGLATLRLRIENVKAILLPAVVAAQDETAYSATLRAYIAKVAANDLIGPGIEYWMRQKTSLSATGTNENKSLPDPIAALRDLGKRLAVEIENLAGNPAVTLFSVNVSEAPGISGDGDLVTQDPFAWPIEYQPYTNPGVVQQ